MDTMQLRALAKKIFFAHDGSTFWMSRGEAGVEEQYRRCKISPKLEAAWLGGLTELRLKRLSDPGNWRVIFFLAHHCDFTKLHILAEVEPRGVLAERCLFLEELLAYTIRCDCTAALALRQSTLDRIVGEAKKLLRRARAPNSQQRVQELLAAAVRARRRLARSSRRTKHVTPRGR